MSEVFRRVILKPDGLSDEVSARLAKSLDEAVKAQQRLASKSPHVLQFVGSLQENEKAFFVDHEPAEILISSPDLFSPDVPPTDPKQLLQITVAILDALRAVHSGAISPIRAHGGVCPGVIVKTADGVEKLTDFSFAPAICDALDIDRYMNLAVGMAAENIIDGTISGQWEILSVDEYDREDRICAFIDPEKYGTGMMDGFEPGSDIIAAGIYLHLLAEHQHPYLHADPDAHRMVEMSEFMAQNLFNQARRQDLRESDDEAIKLWCGLVSKMLARLPKNRPSAAEATESLSAFVKPIDAGELLRRQLEQLKEEVKAGPPDETAWQSIEQTARTIAQNESAPGEVRNSATKILRLAEARSIVAQADALLHGDDWQDARPLLANLPSTSELPGDLATQADDCIALLRKYTEATDQLTTIRKRIESATDGDPSATLATLDECETSLGRVASESPLPASVQQQNAELGALLADRRLALAEQQEALEEETTMANEWLAGLTDACDAEDWAGYSDRLASKPEIAHWPNDAAERQGAQQLRFDEYGQAKSWLDQLIKAHDDEAWNAAFRLIMEEPALSNWPPTLRKEADALIELTKEAQREQEEEARANKWITDLAEAVQSQNWAAAGAVLDGRPDIQRWPEGIDTREKDFRAKIAEHVADEERESLAKAEAKRLAATWLEEAESLATKKNWDGALGILKRPPEIGYFPAEVRKQADELIKTCTSERDVAVRKRHQGRIDSATTQAKGVAEQVLAGELAAIVNVDLVTTTVEQFEIEAEGSEGFGSAVLSITLPSGKEADPAAPIELPFQFAIEGESTSITDSKPSLAESITTQLTAQLLDRQRANLSTLVQPLRAGLFPGAKLDGSLDKLAAKTKVKILLAAKAIKTRECFTTLEWDPQNLAWRFADKKEIVKPILDIVGTGAQSSVVTKLLENSKLLQQYRSRISCDIAVPAPPDSDELPSQLAVTATLTFRSDKKSKPVTLTTVELSCADLAEFKVTSDPAAADKALSSAIVTQQTAASEKLRQGIVERISKAPVKARLEMRPKQISEPTDTLKFDVKCLTCKKRPVGALAANWNMETFQFDTAKTWNDELDAVLVAPRKGETGPPIALIGGGALVAVVLIIVVAMGFRKGPRNEFTQKSGPNVTKVAKKNPKKEQPQPPVKKDPTPATIEQTTATDAQVADARARLEAALAKSPYLKPIIDDAARRELVFAGGDANDGLPWAITIPGLQDDPIAITLQADEDLQDKIGQIAAKLKQLDEMLSLSQPQAVQVHIDEAVQEVIDQHDWSEFLVASSVRSERLAFPDGTTTPWTLQNGQWRTSDATCDLILQSEDADNNSIPVGRISVHLLAWGGEIAMASPSEELSSQLNQLFTPFMQQRQQQSASNLKAKLQADLQSSGMQAVVALTASPEGLIRDLSLTASMATLRPRDFSAPWDDSSLAFLAENASTPWPEAMARFKLAGDILTELNSLLAETESGASTHWIRQATREPLQERSVDDFWWTLAAVAPWSTATPPDNLGPKDLLPLELDVSVLSTDRPAREIAAAILDTDLAKPAYWPLVDEYLTYKDTGSGSQQSQHFLAGNRASEWGNATSSEAFKQNVLPFWQSSPKPIIMPATTLRPGRTQVVASNDTAGPSQLVMEFGARWELARSSPRIPKTLSRGGFDFIQQALQTQFGEAQPCNLSTDLGEGGFPTRNWSALEPSVNRFVETLAHVRFLNEALATLDARIALEDQFNTLLPAAPGTNVTIAAEEAFGYLAAIWKIKGETPPAGNLDGIAANLLQAHQAAGGRLGNKWATAKPALFVEFFCGPTATYAISWSVNEAGQSYEGPTLLKLCPRSAITNRNSTANLGEALFGAVMGSLAKSIRRPIDLSDKEIGLILAPDDPMQLVDLPALRFAAQTSRIQHRTNGTTAQEVWQSLKELQDKDQYNCAFRLCRSLANYNKQWSRQTDVSDALQWATQTIDQAWQTP